MDERVEKWLYDSISDENIWAIVINNLPALKKEIQRLLDE